MIATVWNRLWELHDETKELLFFNPKKIVDRFLGKKEHVFMASTNTSDISGRLTDSPAEHNRRLKSGPDGVEDGEPRAYSTRQMVGLFLGPLLFLVMLVIPTPDGMKPEAQSMAAIALLMATWWMTESLPIPATSLIPLMLFPIMNVLPAPKAAAPYADHLIYLFMGGFIIALSMERWGLHKRIAMNVIKIVGFSADRLVLGFMTATAIISAFVSNTATTVMMMPIGMAVIAHVIAEGKREGLDKEIDFSKEKFAFGLNIMLGIAYASSIGGIATLIGTPPNAVVAGYVNKTFGKGSEIITFANWLQVGVPLVVVMLPLTWLLLVKFINPMKLKKVPGGKDLINKELKDMGSMSKGEIWTSIIFGLTAIAWILKDNALKGVLPKGVSDATIAMTGALILFLIPINLKKNEFVMNWETAAKLPWGVLILFGGGLAMAAGFSSTGLAAWIGKQVLIFKDYHWVVLVLAVTITIVYLTELTSNTATATMVMPILGSIALGVGQNPLLYVIPAALAASMAFMLPVATPPNAIVFASGYVTIPQMVKSGFWINILAIIMIMALVFAAIIPFYGIEIGVLPEWAQNITPPAAPAPK